MHFAHVLRSAGMAVRHDRVQAHAAGVQAGGLRQRRDFHAVPQHLHARPPSSARICSTRRSVFWRDPDLEGRMRAIAAAQGARNKRRCNPNSARPAPRRRTLPRPRPRRAAAAARRRASSSMRPSRWTTVEDPRRADFDTMSANKWHRCAGRTLARLRSVFEPLPRGARALVRAGRIDSRPRCRLDQRRHARRLGRCAGSGRVPLPAPMVRAGRASVG